MDTKCGLPENNSGSAQRLLDAPGKPFPRSNRSSCKTDFR